MRDQTSQKIPEILPWGEQEESQAWAEEEVRHR